jgi:hypothetical protein
MHHFLEIGGVLHTLSLHIGGFIASAHSWFNSLFDTALLPSDTALLPTDTALLPH